LIFLTGQRRERLNAARNSFLIEKLLQRSGYLIQRFARGGCGAVIKRHALTDRGDQLIFTEPDEILEGDRQISRRLFELERDRRVSFGAEDAITQSSQQTRLQQLARRRVECIAINYLPDLQLAE
jgi:hypothetical protein